MVKRVILLQLPSRRNTKQFMDLRRKKIYEEQTEHKYNLDSNKKKHNKLSLGRKIVIVISIIVLVCVGINLTMTFYDYHKSKRVYNDLRTEFKPDAVGTRKLDASINTQNQKNEEKNSADSNMETIIDDGVILSSEKFDELKNLNNDFIGWISIPNTEISYPIVQNVDDDQYYLSHNFYNEEDVGGAIFVDRASDPAFKVSNTFIHGHHMRNGSMFGTLNKFLDSSFANKNKIYIVFKEETYVYEVFSAYEEGYNEKTYASYSSRNEEEYKNYLNWILGKSDIIAHNSKVCTKDSIITLSTCGYDTKDGRIVIHAKLIGSIK